MKIQLRLGDCIDRLKERGDNSIGVMVSDPPYDLVSGDKKGFMGKEWDGTGIAFSQELWAEIYRVLKPGGVVKAFGGTRTFHRMASAMEEAGFMGISVEAWTYGSGFPKSLNIGRAIDKQGGVQIVQSHQLKGITFAQTLQSHRKAAGVSKTEMASWFPYTEVTKNWERLDNGFRVPSESDFQVLKDRLGLPDSLCEGLWAEDQRRLVSDGGADRRGDGTVIGLAHTGKVWAPVTEEAQQWEGWGTALKPAWEPILVGRKPKGSKS